MAGASGSVFNTLPGPKGTSTPVFLQPDAGKIGAGFDFLQPRTGVGNQLQSDAVGEQQNLGSILGSLLGDTSQTRQREISEGFQGAGDVASAQLSRRGIDPSLLGAQQGIQREQGLSLGDLNDQLSQQRISGETDIANSISQLLLGSSGQAGGLLASLLGAGGIGNISSSSSTNPVSVGGGPSGGPSGDSLFDSPFNPFPGGNPFNFGSGQSNLSGGPGGPGGPTGPGPQTSDNPFFDPGVDLGPLQDPEQFKKNQEELTRINEELDAILAGLNSTPPGGAPPLLAQSAQGTQSAITTGGNLA